MERFQRAGLTFDVRDGGPVDGEPVVLLHGFPQDSSSWSAVEPLLHAAGMRTFAPDQRGYSPGARPPRRADYLGVELVDDVLALLDQAGLPGEAKSAGEAGLPSAHVVGHDWGGVVAWLLAGLHPERVRSLTVLSTPHPRAILPALRSSTQALKSWYMLYFQLPWIPEFTLGRSLASVQQRSGLPQQFAVHNAQRMREPGALTGALNWYRALPMELRSPQPRCPVPTTYIWGRRDAFLSRRAAEMTADQVTADYRFVELDANHWLPETHPAEVAELITDRVSSV
jgi:pimeloyl-ACP methyl ester carboxylesterase